MKHAVNNLPENSDATKIQAMIDLQKNMHGIISDVAKSKICLLIHARSATAKVLYQGKVANTDNELQKAWYAQLPTKEVAKKYYHIYFALRDETETWTRLIFDIALELKVWCPVEDVRLDLCKKGKKHLAPKVHVFSSIVSNKLRDSFRNKVFRNAPHGISVTVTETGRKVRRKKYFVFEENVTGWGSQKHLDYVDARKAPACAPDPGLVRICACYQE